MHRKIIPDLIKQERPIQEGRVCELPETGTAYDAAQRMMSCNVAAIAVTGDTGQLVGIVTERDLTRRVLGEKKDPDETFLAEIMTRDPDVLRPDDRALDALDHMNIKRYRHMPVVNDNHEVVAMVSMRHLYSAVQQDLEDDVRGCEAYITDTGYGARR